MNFIFPTISIDMSWFLGLGQKSFLGIAGTLFLYGGWLLLLFVIIKGGLRLWLYTRRCKYFSAIDFMLLAIDVPKGNEQSPKAIEHIFSHLQGARSSINFREKWWEGRIHPPLSLELVSIEGYIQFLVRTPIKYRNVVEAAFYAQYPDIEIVEVNDYVDAVPRNYPNEEYDWFGGDIILKKPSPFPIRTYPQFEHPLSGEFKDPLANFLESLGKMKKGEQAWIQFVITPGGESVVKEGGKIVDKFLGREKPPKPSLVQKGLDIPAKMVGEVAGQVFGGGAEVKKTEKKEADMFKVFNLTKGERDVIESIQDKIAKVAFDVKCRWVYYAKKENFNVGNIYGHMKGFMKQYSTSNLNALGSYRPTLTKGDYFWQKWQVPRKKRELITNFKYRDPDAGGPGFILNIEELATIYHFPAIEVKAPLVKKAESKRAEPPFSLPTK